MILRETVDVVRSRPPLVISRTAHGFVCASAGVDASNTNEPGTVILLPVDPDASAAALRAQRPATNGATKTSGSTSVRASYTTSAGAMTT